jgi:hypothetical protein
MLTVGTNENGDADASSGSKYPVGFHPDVLFSGRCFPYHTLGGDIYAPDGNYTSSHTNYTNLAMTDLCFQMFAEVADVDQLMKMVRATTLTNKIHLDGKTQNLHLISPAGFFLKYLMPTVPTSITEGKTAALQQGYYHGVVFNIPGAEVNINGEWVLFSKANQERIMSQNPFTLQWRINSEYFQLMAISAATASKDNSSLLMTNGKDSTSHRTSPSPSTNHSGTFENAGVCTSGIPPHKVTHSKNNHRDAINSFQPQHK